MLYTLIFFSLVQCCAFYKGGFFSILRKLEKTQVFSVYIKIGTCLIVILSTKTNWFQVLTIGSGFFLFLDMKDTFEFLFVPWLLFNANITHCLCLKAQSENYILGHKIDGLRCNFNVSAPYFSLFACFFISHFQRRACHNTVPAPVKVTDIA